MDITELVNLYSDGMYKWANYKINDRELAMDLVQDTFLAAIKSKNNFKEESSPKTWLFSILNNKIIDHYRNTKRKNTVYFEDSETISSEKITDSLFDASNNWSTNGLESSWQQNDNLLDNADFNKTLDFCMDDLPTQWRQLLNLKYLSNKNSDDICQECNISKSNYWQIIHRAKLLMKHCLDVKWFAN